MSNESKTQVQSFPRFIKNQPLGEDKFDGKSQEKIADSIVSLLKNDECQMFGIDGGWGVGKSNLVKIVQKKIEGECPENFHFFTYDAWGHQEDEPRRSVLEELTVSLVTELNEFKTGEWPEKKKELLAKKKETVTKTKPTLSTGFILAFFAVVFTPILNSITEDIDPWYIKVPIMAFPLLVVIAHFFYRFSKTKVSEEKSNSWRANLSLKFRSALENTFEFYRNDQIKKSTFENIIEEIPSVSKFRAWMSEISKTLGSKQLVIVFDNFDRLPVIKVKALWASIHTFFSDDNDYRNIRVVIPFDREHINSAFKADDIYNNESGGDSNKQIRACYGNDFVNKTFDVVFRISIPMLSDWEKFFMEQWEYSFGKILKHQKSEYNKVIQIYDRLSKRITPRDIVAFINECVTIRLTLKENIPFRYIAFFIKGKELILNDPIGQISDPGFLGPLEDFYRIDNDLPKYIAAITYQVNSNKAIDVVLKKELRNALENMEVEKVQTISQSKAFFLILNTVISEVVNIGNMVLSLAAICKDGKIKKLIHPVWDDIGKKDIHIGRTGIKLYDYQIELLQNISHELKSIYLVDILKKFYETEDFKALTFVKNFEKLKATAMPFKIDIDKLLKKKHTTVEGFVEYASVHGYKYQYLIRCDEQELDKYLIKLKVEDLRSINYIGPLVGDYKLKGYKAHLYKMLANISSKYDELSVVLDRLKDFGEQIDFQDKINDNTIYSHIANFKRDGGLFYDLLAMRLARQKSFGYQQQVDNYLNNTDEESQNRLKEVLHFYISHSNLLVGLQHFGKYPLYKKLAQKITKERKKTRTADVRSVMAKFKNICQDGDIHPNDLINSLSDWNVPEIGSNEIPEKISIYLLEETKNNQNRLAKFCRKKVIDYLNSLNEDSWFEKLKNVSSYEVQAALMLNYSWSVKSKNAIKRVLVAIAEESISIPDEQSWGVIISRIGRKKTIFNNVLDVLCARPKELNSKLFLFFVEWLFDFSSFENKQSLRKIFPANLLGNRACVEIMLKNKDKMLKVIINAGDEADDFIEALSEQEENPEAFELLHHVKQYYKKK